jgi:hypothetical protein
LFCFFFLSRGRNDPLRAHTPFSPTTCSSSNPFQVVAGRKLATRSVTTVAISKNTFSCFAGHDIDVQFLNDFVAAAHVWDRCAMLNASEGIF